jgi:hypothetical protein
VAFCPSGLTGAEHKGVHQASVVTKHGLAEQAGSQTHLSLSSQVRDQAQ